MTNGWSNFLNSLEFPVQVLVRQHIPDLGRVREELLASRPDHMRGGPVSEVGHSLLRYRQLKGFVAMQPALRRGVGDMYLTDAHTLLRLFPFGPPDLDKRTGTLFGVDLRSRTPVLYDPFHDGEMNAHMVVMARSGAGKSFLTKLRVVREALRDVDVYLIDPEGEYGVITEALGGRVLVPGAPGYGLNPFALVYTNDGDLRTRIAGLGSLVEVMLSGEVDVDRRSMID